jgi:hypothetical protein
MLQCQKFILKIHTKSQNSEICAILKFFFREKSFFFHHFSYAHAFSEVILDCQAKIVFTKLLAMLIANFYWKTLSL